MDIFLTTSFITINTSIKFVNELTNANTLLLMFHFIYCKCNSLHRLFRNLLDRKGPNNKDDCSKVYPRVPRDYQVSTSCYISHILDTNYANLYPKKSSVRRSTLVCRTLDNWASLLKDPRNRFSLG